MTRRHNRTHELSDAQRIAHFCRLVNEYDDLCSAVPVSVASFELVQVAEPIAPEERWHRMIRAMALRKFVLGQEATVRADTVLDAIERSLVETTDLDGLRADFRSIGRLVNVNEGHGGLPVKDVLEDLIYGTYLHGDYDRYKRSMARASLTRDMALWMWSEQAEFHVRNLRGLVVSGVKEGKLERGVGEAVLDVFPSLRG